MSVRGRVVAVGSDKDDEMIDKDLPQDLYGATLYGTVICLRDENWPHLVLSWAKMAVNIFLQVFIIVQVHYHINPDSASVFQPSVGLRVWIDRLEEVTPYHRFENNTLSTPVLDSGQAIDADVINFCNGLPVGWLLHISWFLWTVVSLQEFLACYELLKTLYEAAPVAYGNQAMEEASTYITGLSRPLKGLFFVALVVPKLLISVALWWTGVEFLGYGTDTASVILRIMSLKFVLTLDELLFTAFASKEFKGELKTAKIRDKKHVVPIWLAELLRVLAAALLCGACELYFAEIMELRHACHECVYRCNNLCSNAWDYCSGDPCSTSWTPIFFHC